MTKEKPTIVERSSGFWIVDNSGAIEGPYIHYIDAVKRLSAALAAHKKATTDEPPIP